MPQFQQPIEDDADISKMVEAYKELAYEDSQYPSPPNPQDRPVPDVEYDESGIPIMPDDITAITSRQLGQLFQAIEAWESYYRDLVTKADKERSILKEAADLVAAWLKRDLREQKKKPKDEVTYLYKTDVRYINANRDYLKAKYDYEQLDNLKSMVSRRFSMVSREITRRGDDHYGRDPDKRFHQGSNPAPVQGGARGARL